MMQRIALTLLLMAAAAAPASAKDAEWTVFGPVWHDDDDDGPRRVNPAKKAKSAAAKPSKASATAAAGDDDDDRPQRKAPAEAKAPPPLLEGGPRPSISPSAPRTVAFGGHYPQGSIVIDTAGRALYYVKGGGQAWRYPIAVGKVGFTWTGVERISRKQPWPDWHPPEEMRERKPNLPEVMTGGIRNPLGAMALYLGNSLYRIHGTNDASSIGQAASSGCFRMMNAHVLHLSAHAPIGTTVHVVSHLPGSIGGGRVADEE
jgi:lipoprotein-anchoring transpeptidase ErfK/SrfK